MIQSWSNHQTCIFLTCSSLLSMVLFRDVLCTDKTGTLTMDRIVMVHHLDSWGMSSDKILYFTFLNSYFQTGFKNPLDDAILAYVYTGGYKFEPTKWIRINELPFDFSRRRMSVILEEINHNHVHRNKHPLLVERIMVTKGAYEEVVESMCLFCSNGAGRELNIHSFLKF